MAEVAIIGAGPSGLCVAERLSRAGHDVTVYDQRPSAARKFLMAGRGGLNLTHSEDIDTFITRYRGAADWIGPMVRAFTPQDLRAWCEALGQDTFIGSSGRVFPRAMKASPLLRAWLDRLAGQGVRFAFNHQWCGWDDDGGVILRGNAVQVIYPDALFLGLGGASWPKLGSDGGWVERLRARGVAVADLRPANCGFTVGWGDYFRERFAGVPLKHIVLHFAGRDVPGDIMITERGIEGGPVYALSAEIRDTIERDGAARLRVDLRPGLNAAALLTRLQKPRGGASLSTFLQKQAGLSPVAINMLREGGALNDPSPQALTRAIKAMTLVATAPAGMDRAISSAGGVVRGAVDDSLMLRAVPGVFVAGEMLDWEAPTGGYLLQACFATAHCAASGILEYLESGQGGL